MIERFARRFAQPICYAAALAMIKGISLVMVPFVTGHLAPTDYATVEVLASIADVGGILLGLGLADTLYRFAGDTHAEGGLSAANVFGLALAATGVFLLFGQALAPVLAAAVPGGADTLTVRLLLISLALTACIEVPFASLRMTDRAGRYLILAAGKAVVQAVLVVLALSGGWGVTGIIAAAAVADVLLSAILVATQLLTVRPRLGPAASVRLLRYGAPLTMAGVAGFVLGSCDRWFLTGDATELAQYALAGKFALATAMLMQPFDLWWYPRRLAVLAGADGPARSASVVGLGMALTILAASATALAGPIAIAWLTPPAYHGASAYVPWLALIATLHALASLINVGCYAGRTGDRPMVVNAIAAVVALSGYALLIPGWGAAGAIAATLAAQGTRVALFLHLGRRAAPIAYPLARAGVLAAAAIATVAMARGYADSVAGVAAGGGGLILLAGLAMALRLVPAWTTPPRSLAEVPS